MGERIYYLDHAAATPCDERVVEAMLPFMTDFFCNPSAKYSGGREARQALERAREDVGLIIGAKPHEVLFTAGATESLNIALQGVLKSGGHVVFGATEHSSVREVAKHFPYTEARADQYGRISPEAVLEAITDETVLVSVALADNEFGTVQPVKEISRALQEVREKRRQSGSKTPLFFHSDGSQAAAALDLKVSRLGLDMLTLNAGKCYGPKQAGVLWVQSGVRLEPLMFGGGQERGLRAGTENVAGAVGCALALKLAQQSKEAESKRLSSMREQLISLLETKVHGFVLDGHPKFHLPGHVHFHVDGLDAERVVFNLDNHGISVATGAACAANKDERVPSLTSVGMSDSEADGSLRVTLGHLNAAADIPYVAEMIARAIETERVL